MKDHVNLSLFEGKCGFTSDGDVFDMWVDLWLECDLWSNVYWSVDADEIKRLGKRFRKLDLDNSGSLSIDEFMSLPELQQNPLVQRVIDIFDTDGNGEVDFKGTAI